MAVAEAGDVVFVAAEVLLFGGSREVGEGGEMLVIFFRGEGGGLQWEMICKNIGDPYFSLKAQNW